MRVYFQKLIKFSPQLKELRLHFCQNGKASAGVREFVAQQYPKLKKENPNIPMLIRECEGVQPVLWARYEKGKETSISLTNVAASDISKHLEELGSPK